MKRSRTAQNDISSWKRILEPPVNPDHHVAAAAKSFLAEEANRPFRKFPTTLARLRVSERF